MQNVKKSLNSAFESQGAALSELSPKESIGSSPISSATTDDINLLTESAAEVIPKRVLLYQILAIYICIFISNCSSHRSFCSSSEQNPLLNSNFVCNFLNFRDFK